MDILTASIVWVVFLASNITVGFVMYRLGLHGQLRRWQGRLTGDDVAVEDRVSQTLGYIPGSEYNPFETQHPPRYAPDPITPGGGEDKE